MNNSVYISEPTLLRKKAEEVLEKKPSKTITQHNEINTLKLLHELEVHQIELELQNEELVLAKEQAIAMASEKYAELYNFAPSGYFTLSKEGEIIELNQSGAEMLGKERLRLKKSLFGFFISNNTRPIFNLFLENIFNTKVKESCEVTLLTGSYKPLYAHLAGIVTGNGEQCLVNVTDVTDQKQAEKAIIEFQRLGAIGEMASSVTHDFNNSLQSIIGNLELAMRSTDLPETTLQYLKTIKTIVFDSATRVQLLQRFGGKKQDANCYFFVNLNTLISDVIIQSSPLWKTEPERKGSVIVIKTEYGDIPEVFGNDAELRSVLYNIIKNSIEAMPKGGSLYIETGKNADSIYVTIKDTGIGMDDETKTRIFQPFYSTKGFDCGRGLGMSGAYSILKEHGGAISVKNTSLGNGTTIEIILPVINKEEIIVKEELEAVTFDRVMNVLWVDDDCIISNNAGTMIKTLGHKGDTANSGKEALEYLEQNTYDLVITDIGMPEMNGWELADKINEKFDGKMKVAIVSGWGGQIEESEKIEHGVDYVFSKPFGIDQLQKLLGDVAQVNSEKGL
jgi:two-component system, cell cycle sensor histidine kinase and response regulator CckA